MDKKVKRRNLLEVLINVLHADSRAKQVEVEGAKGNKSNSDFVIAHQKRVAREASLCLCCEGDVECCVVISLLKNNVHGLIGIGAIRNLKRYIGCFEAQISWGRAEDKIVGNHGAGGRVGHRRIEDSSISRDSKPVNKAGPGVKRYPRG